MWLHRFRTLFSMRFDSSMIRVNRPSPANALDKFPARNAFENGFISLFMVSINGERVFFLMPVTSLLTKTFSDMPNSTLNTTAIFQAGNPFSKSRAQSLTARFHWVVPSVLSFWWTRFLLLCKWPAVYKLCLVDCGLDIIREGCFLFPSVETCFKLSIRPFPSLGISTFERNTFSRFANPCLSRILKNIGSQTLFGISGIWSHGRISKASLVRSNSICISLLQHRFPWVLGHWRQTF